MKNYKEVQDELNLLIQRFQAANKDENIAEMYALFNKLMAERKEL